MARKLVKIGAWLGLAYGLAEGIEFCLLGLVPGGLTWDNGNTARVLWVAPVFYGMAGALLGMLVAAVGKLARRVDWIKVFVFIALAGGAFLGASVSPRALASVSKLLLALGIATQLTRVFVRHREWWLSLVDRTLPQLAGVVVVVALGEMTANVVLERAALGSLPAAGPHPNVLILVADTLRADHLSAYGYARTTTPNIDRLAREGTLFLNAYSDSSWTLPSHASLFTGRRLSDHHAGEENRPYLDRRLPTLAEVLGRAGYTSGGFVANVFWCGRQSGIARGFIHYEDYHGNVADALARTALGRMLFYNILPLAGFIDIPGRKSAADINERVLRWIDGLGDHPFFVFVNYLDVHKPNIPPRSHRGRFARVAVDPGVREIALGGGDDDTRPPGPAALQFQIDSYDESLLYLDEQVGRLSEALARRGLLDRTIVVLTADHGEAFGEHNLLGHGGSLYEDQIRIPFVVRFPSRVPAGGRDQRPVALDQIPRLISDLAGLTGTPFPLRLALGDAASEYGDIAISEVRRRPGFPATLPSSQGLQSLQTAQWKLIVNGGGRVELYDLQADRAESKNLAADSRFAEVLSRLRRRLDSEINLRLAFARGE